MARIIPRCPNYEIYIKNINGTDVHYVFADSYREAFDVEDDIEMENEIEYSIKEVE